MSAPRACLFAEASGPGRPRVRMAVPGIVAHLDLDAFFAAVEQLESPELETKPLVVGGDPRGRGVVATANYVARRFGIQSAMSCAEALRRCPSAVFVRPRNRADGRAHGPRRGLPRSRRDRPRLLRGKGARGSRAGHRSCANEVDV